MAGVIEKPGKITVNGFEMDCFECEFDREEAKGRFVVGCQHSTFLLDLADSGFLMQVALGAVTLDQCQLSQPFICGFGSRKIAVDFIALQDQNGEFAISLTPKQPPLTGDRGSGANEGRPKGAGSNGNMPIYGPSGSAGSKAL